MSLSLILNNRYQVLESLGKGGFGETFLAIDTHLPSAKKCVIKQLKPAVRSHIIPDWLKERFAKEAAILEELGEKNPQIPALYAYFSEGGDFYLVQEWIKGETLTQIHQRQGNLSPKEVEEILIGILPVLDYIHSRRIIHRDLKPDNIILRSEDQKPVLIDFGIVKETVATMVHSNGNTPYSVGLGTPGYMASEQAAGRPIVSSDLYSLGLTAVFLLTGKTPQYLATDPNTGEVLWRKEAPNIKSNLADIIDRTVRFHPRDRFSTATEMLNALQVSHTLPTGATIAVGQQNLSLTSPPTSTTTTPENQPPWALLALGSFLAASAIMGGLMLGIVLGTKERSQPTSSPSVLPQSPERTPTPEFSPPKPSPRRRINNRRSQPSTTPTPIPEVKPTPTPTIEASPIPEVEHSPTPTIEASPIPEVKSSPIPEVKPSPSPTIEASPILSPIPEPTKAVPIPVEPPPESSELKETNEEQSSNPSIVVPNIPSQPSQEKPSQEGENNHNIQQYFESDREENKANIQQYFESEREEN